MWPAYWARSTSAMSDAASSYFCRNVRYPLSTVIYADGWTNDISFGSMHSGGAFFLFGDGSCRFLSKTTDLKVLQAVATRRGGEVVDLP
jgi:prepilin-type processing-associated H-X9-DG protein